MSYLQSFQLWLQSQQLNPNTVRNYLSDISIYLQSTTEESAFSQKSINSYIVSIAKDPNAPRYISAINKFCQFGLDQGIIKTNIAKLDNSQQELIQHVEKYRLFLFQKNKSIKTIENYTSDVYQFIDWLNQNVT